jgi:hypothetical protein
LFVHIGDPSSNQATTLESQMIHMIQELFGQTVSPNSCFQVNFILRSLSNTQSPSGRNVPKRMLHTTWGRHASDGMAHQFRAISGLTAR